MIRCGRCKQRHPSVDDVRACFQAPPRSRKRQRQGRQKRRLPARTKTSAPTVAPMENGRGINQVGTGRTRDVTMWERPEWERDALVRLRQLDQEEY
jgi:hypothetical protein